MGWGVLLLPLLGDGATMTSRFGAAALDAEAALGAEATRCFLGFASLVALGTEAARGGAGVRVVEPGSSPSFALVLALATSVLFSY